MTEPVHDDQTPVASILYDSDLVIRDPSVLATLLIFYDRILLPWMPEEGVRRFIRLKKIASRDGDAYLDFDMIEVEGLGDFHVEWDRKARMLFEAGVLERLPAPARDIHFESVDEMAAMLEGIGANISFEDDNSRWLIKAYYAARVFHRIRDDVHAPRLFDVGNEEHGKDLAELLQAEAVFKYILPGLKEIGPEELLRLREVVRDTREGFLLHLQKLSRDIQVRLLAGENINELARYARAVVRSDLIPDYEEFKRQILSEQRSRGLRLLEAGAKVLQIEAPITSPRFYGAVLEALGVPWVSSVEKRRESLTNRSLAMLFMRQIEERLVHRL